MSEHSHLPPLNYNTIAVLKAYCAGQLTWRRAASRLMLDKYEQLEELVRQSGLCLSQPSAAKEDAVLQEMTSLFLDEVNEGPNSE